MKRIVVVGGVAGGMSFATRYRRLNEEAHIIVVDKGPYVSFANCGLPYYLSGEIEERSSLLVADRDMLTKRFQLDIRTDHEVMGLNHKDKTISVLHQGKRSEIEYDELVLAPGAKAFMPETKGMAYHKNIHTVRNIPDVDAITAIDNPKTALVIGAGFIGLETAESLKNKGLEVTLVEKAPAVLAPFDSEMSIAAHNELVNNGIDVRVGTSVVAFNEKTAVLEDGSIVECDLVIMSVGVSPATDFLKDSGIDLGMRGGILVDESYKTNLDHVWAVGDAILVKNQINNEPALISLASPANRQGRQLADIMSGLPNSNKGSIGTAVVRIFDLTFASTGLNERQLDSESIQVMHLLGMSNAGYFPGASPLNLKVIYDKKTHKILGAQAYGKKGIDKRIDVLATAIKAGMLVDQLQELELSYAPPYGSAKDPVNMAGYYAYNIIHELTHTIQWHQVRDTLNQGAILVDVRSDKERSLGHIQGSIHIPLDDLRCRMGELDSDKEIIVHCQSGVRSYNAERILKQAGFNVRNLDGSYSLYSRILPKEIV